jgi:hypothetical protein
VNRLARRILIVIVLPQVILAKVAWRLCCETVRLPRRIAGDIRDEVDDARRLWERP